jgi:hypothetical protein
VGSAIASQAGPDRAYELMARACRVRRAAEHALVDVLPRGDILLFGADAA